MKSKVVILGNSTDWCEKSLKDLLENENAKLLNSKYLCNLKFIQTQMIRIHFSYKINRFIKIPFKRIWFKKLAENISKEKDSDILLIVYDRSFLSLNEQFINYLRKRFTKIKIVYLFTNIVKYSGAQEFNFVEKLNRVYDLVYAFDPDDAIKYNFQYSPLIYSMNDVKHEDTKQQVFYVGKAKDRLEMILKCYEKFNEIGIDTNFSIFGVSDNEKKYDENIKYNKYISYDECLKHINESSCLLDIIQGDSAGYTIKTCEAIYYDKLLITTNKNIVNEPFYDSRYILVIDNAEDIKKDFFDNKKVVKYSKEAKDYFSAKTFMEKVRKDLEKVGKSE